MNQIVNLQSQQKHSAEEAEVKTLGQEGMTCAENCLVPASSGAVSCCPVRQVCTARFHQLSTQEQESSEESAQAKQMSEIFCRKEAATFVTDILDLPGMHVCRGLQRGKVLSRDLHPVTASGNDKWHSRLVSKKSSAPTSARPAVQLPQALSEKQVLPRIEHSAWATIHILCDAVSLLESFHQHCWRHQRVDWKREAHVWVEAEIEVECPQVLGF